MRARKLGLLASAGTPSGGPLTCAFTDKLNLLKLICKTNICINSCLMCIICPVSALFTALRPDALAGGPPCSSQRRCRSVRRGEAKQLLGQLHHRHRRRANCQLPLPAAFELIIQRFASQKCSAKTFISPGKIESQKKKGAAVCTKVCRKEAFFKRHPTLLRIHQCELENLALLQSITQKPINRFKCQAQPKANER